MTKKFSLARWLGVRKQLDQFWADTEVSPPDTIVESDYARLAAAEAEWFSETMDPPAGSDARS